MSSAVLDPIRGDLQQGANLAIAVLDQNRPRLALNEPTDPHDALAVKAHIAFILQVREPAPNRGIDHRRHGRVDEPDEDRSTGVEYEVARPSIDPVRYTDLLQALVASWEDVVIGQQLIPSCSPFDRFRAHSDPVRLVLGVRRDHAATGQAGHPEASLAVGLVPGLDPHRHGDVRVEIGVILGASVREEREIVDRRAYGLPGDQVGDLAREPDAAFQRDVELQRLVAGFGGGLDAASDKVGSVERRVHRQLVTILALLREPQEAVAAVRIGLGRDRSVDRQCRARECRRGHDRARDRLVRLGVADDPFDGPGQFHHDRTLGAVDGRIVQPSKGGIARLIGDAVHRSGEDLDSLICDGRARDREVRQHVAAQSGDPEPPIGAGQDPVRQERFGVQSQSSRRRARLVRGIGPGTAVRPRNPDLMEPDLDAGQWAAFEVDQPALDRQVAEREADGLAIQIVAQAEAGSRRDDREAPRKLRIGRVNRRRLERDLEPAVLARGLPRDLVLSVRWGTVADSVQDES